jgi:hypothetical protein
MYLYFPDTPCNTDIRNKKPEHLQVTIDELEAHSKIKNIRDLYRGIKGFKKCYQTRINTVKMRKFF